jgi:hypothetical protein
LLLQTLADAAALAIQEQRDVAAVAARHRSCVGGRVIIAPAAYGGRLVAVTPLVGYTTPEQFVPGLPFYPV